MRIILFFIFFVFSFSCNTSNFNSAYQDYYKNQQIYINALLNNDKKKQIKALKELIQCGNYLHFDISDYKSKLSKLSSKKTNRSFKTKQLKKVNHKYQKNKKTHKNNYINILSYTPLQIKNARVYRIFDIKSKKLYKKVIDLKYAITPKPYIKKIINKNLKLKIAQFRKNIVRIVYYSTKPIKINIKKEKNKIIISPISNLINKKLITSHKSLKNFTSPKYKNSLNVPKKPSHSLFKNKKIIVIDPGHGGKDSGGIGIGGRKEKIAVLEIAKKVKKYLQQKGYVVYLTRSSDIFRKLKWRTHFANKKHADLFISIHCNIAPNHIYSPHGIETYFLSPTRSSRAIRVARLENKEVKGLNYLDQRVILNFLNRDRIISSNKLAIDIQNSILQNLRSKFSNVKNGGVRPAPFWVLVGTQMPAILIETGYLTNPIEAKRLFDPSYQSRLAKGIAEGVVSYFKKNP